MEIAHLEKHIKEIPLVEGIHHSHLWSLDGEKHIFTTHLVLQKEVDHKQIDEIKARVKSMVKDFDILEATIEIEFTDSHCLDPKHS